MWGTDADTTIGHSFERMAFRHLALKIALCDMTPATNTFLGLPPDRLITCDVAVSLSEWSVPQSELLVEHIKLEGQALKSWILHCLSDATCTRFSVTLSAFDQLLDMHSLEEMERMFADEILPRFEQVLAPALRHEAVTLGVDYSYRTYYTSTLMESQY